MLWFRKDIQQGNNFLLKSRSSFRLRQKITEINLYAQFIRGLMDGGPADALQMKDNLAHFRVLGNHGLK